jgi:hypothetical protein
MEEESMTEWLKRLLGVEALELKVDQYKAARDADWFEATQAMRLLRSRGARTRRAGTGGCPKSSTMSTGDRGPGSVEAPLLCVCHSTQGQFRDFQIHFVK